ncbi:MAG: hypothetical protein JST52_04085 [Bacteroidetes bacterium]|nr:hypothetical protein [Bacteroidota bacterium]MBS1741182.1 hypothetical protein [Bacteroidota bacterium]
MRWLLLLFLVSVSQPTYSQQYVYDYSPLCSKAYDQYMSLNLSAGNATIKQELVNNPYNLMATYLADYEDCLLLLMNGDKRDYQQRENHFDERLELLEKGTKHSPWHRLCKAGLYFHWALVHIRFGENLQAATTFRRSFLLLKENAKLFPDFPQNQIFLGTEEAVVGTVPDNYQWLASIFGMKGDVKKGVAKLNHFINTGNEHTPLRTEAIIFQIYLKFYLLSQQEEVWNFVNSLRFSTNNNLLHSFVKANIALNFRKADVALQTLQNARQIADYNKYPILDFETGTALLHKLDPEAATYFLRFLARFRGNFFVKDAYQKLSFLSYLQKNLSQAAYYRQQVLKQGSKLVDADKQAMRFAESNICPAPAILEARLLSDGGYYQVALQKLLDVDANKLSLVDRLEYYFRLGRIYDELDNDSKSIQFYTTTIQYGRSRPEHFAARSALQMGMMYERKGKKNDALRCYNDCLSMRGHDFQANIDQQAKAGLNRLLQ